MFFRKKTRDTIEFLCLHDRLDSASIPHPVPSNKHLPKWFRKLSREMPMSKFEIGTAKRCIPVLDAMSQGFVIPLWADLTVYVGRPVDCYNSSGDKISEINFVSDDFTTLIGQPISNFLPDDVMKRESVDPSAIISFAQRQDCDPKITMQLTSEELTRHDKEQVKGANFLKLPFGKDIYKFTNPWVIKTPKGWSIQIKNPSNSFETNIHCLEGVVDTDEYHLNINLPFIWTGKDEGEFLIPRGTPIVQVIPFERKALDVKIGDTDQKETAQCQNKLQSAIVDRYRRLFWHKRKKEQ